MVVVVVVAAAAAAVIVALSGLRELVSVQLGTNPTNRPAQARPFPSRALASQPASGAVAFCRFAPSFMPSICAAQTNS